MNSPSLRHSWSGRLLGESDRYRIEKILSTGNMGDVYLATDTKLLLQVAIKLLKESLVTSTEMRERFKREVACCAALDNKHVVKIIDSGFSSEGFPFYVMEYLKGQSLQQLLKQEKYLSVKRTVAIAKQICSGLQMAHQGVIVAGERVKIVHRDLKPANIFLVSTALGEFVKILDFGIAKKVRDYAGTHNDTNLTNMFVGTFRYAAPEQLEINQTVDERVDIYCLGLVLYEMLSGTDPFGLGSNSQPVGEMTWARAHVHQAAMTLQSQPGGEQIPASLTKIVNKCLQKSPSQRYASIQELQFALDDAIATEEALTITKPPLVALNEEDTSRTIVQSSNAFPVKSAEEDDRTIMQPARSRELSIPEMSSSRTAIQRPISEFTKTGSTVVQFRSDSRLNLDTTVCQVVATMPNISDRLTQQSSKVSRQENQNQDIDQGRGLFPLLFESPSRALSSVWATVRSWIRGNFSSRHTGANSSSPRRHQSEGSAPAPEEPTLDAKSYEDAIKTLNECRLSYAKELARNGKFRDAIATAKSIPETSLLHPQAQMLINRWKHM